MHNLDVNTDYSKADFLENTVPELAEQVIDGSITSVTMLKASIHVISDRLEIEEVRVSICQNILFNYSETKRQSVQTPAMKYVMGWQ